MKKNILTTAFALSVLFLHAQYLGFKGGLTFSRANLEYASSESLRFGYHAGLMINVPLTESFSVQPEVLLTTKGTRAKYTLFGLDGTNSLNFTYLDVPVLGVLEIGEMFELQAGPYIGFMLSNRFLTEVDQTQTEITISRESFRNVDYGIAFGFGLNFGAIQTGATYYLGLQDLSESDDANLIFGDLHNRVLQVYLCFRLGNYKNESLK